ncbi:hypothetical protein FNJ87_14510 [Nonlabens mediterrranea]|uniref:Peptidylprolyl isomerase n=1 Tax=Nonlabens mediterrranea TaxID=1419947 RepID=A0ABS0A7W6_9FLAO|nr:conserved hypothetical protein [Flavobacteria bacterium BBFL7]MBF4985488.1 hypothetical protein [Nonlabens mediterrranea]
MYKLFYYIAFLLFLSSCEYFQQAQPVDAVVMVGDAYLSQDDIKNLLPDQYTKEDSAIIVSSYINNWATERLLMQNARKNISLSQQEQLDKLIEKYRFELYSQAYKQELTKQNLDTVIKPAAVDKYFEEHQKDFKLNEDLVQFRYIQLDPLYTDVGSIDKLFKSGTEDAYRKLDSLSLGFKSHFLNDSIWVQKKIVFDRVSAINPSNEERYIKDKKYWKLEDSVGVYLVRFNNVLRRGDNAPLSYVKPTIKQVLLNRRKLNYIKKLEKDLLDDAIKSKKFQIKS